MTSFQDVLGAARSLTPPERVRLIDALWESVDPNDWTPPSEEWIAEVRRRSAEHDAGRMTASSATEVRERARRQAKLDD